MKRSPLRRRTPLKRGQSKLTRGRLNPVSSRRRRRDADYEQARQAVLARSEGRCEVDVHSPGCSGRVEQTHHIGGRGGPDPHRLDNLLGCSAACHAEIHANPNRSYLLGLMVRRNGR
jgi:hypothetical protein